MYFSPLHFLPHFSPLVGLFWPVFLTYLQPNVSLKGAKKQGKKLKTSSPIFSPKEGHNLYKFTRQDLKRIFFPALMNQRSFLTWRGLLSTLMEVFLRTHTEKLEPLMCLAFLFVLCIGIGTLQNGPHINLINLLPFFSFTSMGFNDAWVLKKFRIIRESEFLNCFLYSY